MLAALVGDMILPLPAAETGRFAEEVATRGMACSMSMKELIPCICCDRVLVAATHILIAILGVHREKVPLSRFCSTAVPVIIAHFLGDSPLPRALFVGRGQLQRS